MSKPKLNQPDVEQSTTIEPNIKILTTFNSSDKPETINMNITIPSKMFENIFVTGTSIQPDPTLEEVIKEWEDDGYVFDNFYDDRIALCDNQSSKKIIISKNMKLLISSYYKEIPAPLSFKEIERILRTIKAKGWEI